MKTLIISIILTASMYLPFTLIGQEGNEEFKNGVKVVAAFRTLSWSAGGGLQPIIPKEPEENVLLVLRIEGISIEEFRKTVDRDEIVLRSGGDQYTLGFRQSIGEFTLMKDGKIDRVISPWMIMSFSVPKEMVNFTLVVGENPPVELKLKETIKEHLTVFDLVQ